MKRWYAAGFVLGLLVLSGALWLHGAGESQGQAVQGAPVNRGTVSAIVPLDESDAAERDLDSPPRAPVRPPSTVDPALFGAAVPRQPDESAHSPEMRIGQISVDTKVTPGRPVDITVNIEYTGTERVTALGVLQRLPQGWRFEEIVGGDRPVVAPNKGARGELTFAWIQPPEFPCSFTYRATPTEMGNSPQTLQGRALFRRMAGELRSAPAVTVFNPGVQ